MQQSFCRLYDEEMALMGWLAPMLFPQLNSLWPSSLAPNSGSVKSRRGLLWSRQPSFNSACDNQSEQRKTLSFTQCEGFANTQKEQIAFLRAAKITKICIKGTVQYSSFGFLNTALFECEACIENNAMSLGFQIKKCIITFYLHF